MLTLKRANYKANELLFLARVMETGLDSSCIKGNSYQARDCRTCEYMQMCASIMRLMEYAESRAREIAERK